MKVTRVQIPNLIKNVVLTTPLLFATQNLSADSFVQERDVFVKNENIKSPKNSLEANALSPEVRLAGTTVYPALVIDLSDKLLYHYDLSTDLIDAYPIRFVENEINPGLNLVSIEKHVYDKDNIAEKILLTEINKSNGKVVKTHQQVIVGAKQKDIKDESGIFTNVILINNDDAKKITELLTEEQYVLIRK